MVKLRYSYPWRVLTCFTEDTVFAISSPSYPHTCAVVSVLEREGVVQIGNFVSFCARHLFDLLIQLNLSDYLCGYSKEDLKLLTHFNFSFCVVIRMSLELWGLLMISSRDYLKILPLEQIGDNIFHSLALNHGWVNEEKLHEDWTNGIFVQEKVAVSTEELWDLFSLHVVYKAILELKMNSRRELSLLSCLGNKLNVLIWLQMIHTACSSCIHHHLVYLSIWILPTNDDWLIL